MANIPLFGDGRREKLKKDISPGRVILISFLLVILVGAGLLMLPISTYRGGIPFINALFTATSATCVTGLVVYDTATTFTLFGQCVILGMIQIGGLGLVTFTTFAGLALGRRLDVHSMKLASESINSSNVYQVGSLIKIVIRVTFACELAGALLLSFAFVPKFGLPGVGYSIFTSVSAFCNAGFDLFGGIRPYSSLAAFAQNPYVLGVIGGLIVCGGLGFVVWHDLLTYRQNKRLRLHTKLVVMMTLLLIVAGALGFALMEWDNPNTLGALDVSDRVGNALFQSVTTRTAGFESVPVAGCRGLTKIFMSVLMFIGAAPGGTGGGIKVTTIAVLVVAVISVIRGREDAAIFGRRIDKKTVYRALSILFLSICAVIAAILAIFYNTDDSVDIVDSIFEAFSAFGTVGLTAGATASMQAVAKVVTMLTMFIGRVGPVTLAIGLAMGSGRNNRKEVLPEGQVTIG
ncbi:MAG: TrkH family potassium uptake protein [Oscillospiraceae bacterium]|nr:TrkH family potassium uptake protein [Oscillospiraceae bacterium]